MCSITDSSTTTLLTFSSDGSSYMVSSSTDSFLAAQALEVNLSRNGMSKDAVTLIPASEDIMGWDVTDSGLKVRFSQDIPALVRGMMAENIAGALSGAGWSRSDLKVWAVHPGGVRVLDAYAEALGLSAEEDLAASWEVLRRHGNMSSATVLFVLRRLLEGGAQGRGLLSAMGPGFSAEHVLMELA